MDKVAGPKVSCWEAPLYTLIFFSCSDGTDNIYYKHYAIGTSKHLFHTEGIVRMK